MNLRGCPLQQPRRRVPRIRGDEPLRQFIADSGFCVFPASAGMNRHYAGVIRRRLGVPRIRGDEPLQKRQLC